MKRIISKPFTASTAPETVSPITVPKPIDNRPPPRVIPVLVEAALPSLPPCGGQRPA